MAGQVFEGDGTALTAKGVKGKKDPGMYGDGGGLYLRVGPTGAKSWILRVFIHGKRRELGLGSFDLVSLADAREKAVALRKVARAGGDPDAERKAAEREAVKEAIRNRLTFADAVAQVHAKLLPIWRSPKHGEIWLASLNLYAIPVLGKKAIHTLGRDDILKVLEPIWTTKAETARRLKQRLNLIFDWAAGEGHYTHPNPVQMLKLALPDIVKDPVHRSAMPWREVPAFWSQLAEREGMSAQCLQFIILTAAQSGEARGAMWSEVDFDGQVWNIPGERMKRGKPHRVPLADEALAVLESVRGVDPVLCFPSPQRGKDGTGKQMTDMVFKSLFLRMGLEGFTTHGFRSAFRDWCIESAKADPDLAEAALSHATGSTVTRAYARSDLINRRRALMEAWASFTCGKACQVVQLVRA